MAYREKSDREKLFDRWTSECYVRGFQRVRAELVNGSRFRMTSESGHAEVVVHLVQYDQLGRAHQFSVTRHVRLHYGLHWVGINPGMGRTVMARLVVAEEAWQKAKAGQDDARLVSLGAEIEYTKLGKKKETMDPKEWGNARRQLGKTVRQAATDVAKAIRITIVAKSAVDKLFNEVPPIVEFVF